MNLESLGKENSMAENVIYSQVKDLIVFASLQLNRTTNTHSSSAT